MVKRDIYQRLLSWKHNSQRKPLVLMGARQVGKTYILSEFVKEYENNLYIDFEAMPEVARIFGENLDPVRIIKQLEILFGISIQTKTTLLVFDEVQACPDALISLKYFNEKANDYHIIAAGSLLGVKLKRSRGFPVGKVNFLHMQPLSFFEYLEAIGEVKLRHFLEEVTVCEAINEALHKKAIDLLKQYFITGGMPEAVKIFTETKDFVEVRKTQQEIIEAYALDFAKHADPSQVMKIMAVWNSIPSQLAKENKKFIFSAISKSARARSYAEAIEWLVDAGLIYKAYNVNTPKIPIDSYANKNIYKVYMLDVGLLGCMSRLPVKIMLEENRLFVEFKGALTENFVAQELMAGMCDRLYYWSSSGIAEVDFVIPYDMSIYPLEVKSGTSSRQKSLRIYAEKYKVKNLARASLMNLTKDADLCNYPLYLISLFPKLMG